MQLTLSEALRTGAEAVAAMGSEDPNFESRVLLMALTGRSRTDLYAHEDERLTSEQEDRFLQAVARRAAGVPLQHILGFVDFRSIRLKCDARALIPRPDSEIVVDLALAARPPRRVADLGTGSGCLLLSILAECPEASGIAVDADAAALGLARENAGLLDLSGRIDFIHGSWRAWTGWGACDLIISNPPYIRSDVISTLAPEVRDYDPMAALDGGADGLDAYREIVQLGADHMAKGAQLVLEIGYDQKSPVSDLLESAGFGNLQHRRDLGGNDRAIAATKS
ncbi:MAG: peptide chain release factor N(5)-glutamine methyltransferase [Pseudomonadota bacterium]